MSTHCGVEEGRLRLPTCHRLWSGGRACPAGPRSFSDSSYSQSYSLINTNTYIVARPAMMLHHAVLCCAVQCGWHAMLCCAVQCAGHPVLQAHMIHISISHPSSSNSGSSTSLLFARATTSMPCLGCSVQQAGSQPPQRQHAATRLLATTCYSQGSPLLAHATHLPRQQRAPGCLPAAPAAGCTWHT